MNIRRRFFTPPENILGDEILLQDQDVSHIRNVLRLGIGDNVAVFDGQGFQYIVEITSSTKDMVKANILSRNEVQNESPLDITLGQSILKGSKLDDIVRKSCELGIKRFVPLVAGRSVLKMSAEGKNKKNQRWRKIAMEASKQSGRSKIPTVMDTLSSVDEFCSNYADCSVKLIFHEEEENLRISELEQDSSSHSSIAILTGPEGGWTTEEVKSAGNHGFQAVSLGPRILRAETAPIAVLSIIQSLWGDF